jgi:hypothetical protein
VLITLAFVKNYHYKHSNSNINFVLQGNKKGIQQAADAFVIHITNT